MPCREAAVFEKERTGEAHQEDPGAHVLQAENSKGPACTEDQ